MLRLFGLQYLLSPVVSFPQALVLCDFKERAYSEEPSDSTPPVPTGAFIPSL